MRPSKRVVVIEHPTIVREGLKALIASDPSIEIVGEAGEGREAIATVSKQAPSMVIIDLCVPGMAGTDIVREITARRSETRVVALANQKNHRYVLEALSVGVKGYVLKDADVSELKTAIDQVFKGRTYLSPEIEEMVILGFVNGVDGSCARTARDLLTRRERQVLKLIAESRSNKQMADYLCVSVKTIETHRGNLMRKLEIHDTAALTTFAIKQGVVEY